MATSRDADRLVPPLLVFGYGNPSRGDDALGPLLIDALRRDPAHAEVEFLTDFQLQIEHAFDLSERHLVLFADADVACDSPCRLERLSAAADGSYTTHAMSPSSVLSVFRQCFRSEPPEAFLLRVRGERFELGEDLSPAARSNLDAAIALATNLLRKPYPEHWLRICSP
ncbi:MAG: hydrogenase maturation protease [Methylotetracoccus sp.]